MLTFSVLFLSPPISAARRNNDDDYNSRDGNSRNAREDSRGGSRGRDDSRDRGKYGVCVFGLVLYMMVSLPILDSYHFDSFGTTN